MKKSLLLSIILIFSWSIDSMAVTGDPPGDSVRNVTDPHIQYAVESALARSFKNLNIVDESQAYDPINIPVLPLADSTLEKRQHAHALLERVMSGQRFLESLDALSEIELPIGIVKSGGALDYSILIDRINFTSKGAVMEVYVSLALPQTGDRIAFNGKIPLSKDGGIVGTAKVFLLGDHPMKLGNTLFVIKGSERTYVEFDCDGFKGVSLEGAVEFSRDMLVPEGPDGQAMQSGRVQVTFTTYAQSLNDLLVGVSIPPFQLPQLKDFGFRVDNAFMDWSDFANPPGIVFPPEYTSPFVQGGLPLLWQGFFLQRLEVRLPPGFSKKEGSGRVAIGLQNVILDDQGVTGKIFAENVLTAGDMSGWAFTIDRVAVEVMVNQVKGFQINGKINVPSIKDKNGNPSMFLYTAHKGADGNYIFAAGITQELKFSLWAANVNLYPGSSFIVKEKDRRFYPSASLSGMLSISIADKGPKANLKGVRFERMVISTEAPYFTPGSFSFGSEGESNSMSGFPISINNIGIKSEGDRVGLALDLTVNISGKAEDEGFGGTGIMTVWGKREYITTTGSEGQAITKPGDYKFDKVELTGIRVNVKKPNVIELAGMINFFDNDPTYGDGFRGELSGKIQSITVHAEALFGKTPAFRYWYADALVDIENGVPMIPGVMSAYGFGGGFYSKMKQSAQSVASPFGRTKSGITYVPDENSMGIRAVVLIGAAKKEAWNGDVGLEVALNRHGGINSITFTGNANFMTPPLLGAAKLKELGASSVAGKLNEKLASLLKGQVYGSVRLHFDNVNDIFHGNLEVYVNVAGGLVRGVSDGNKAGWAELHFEKSNWYVLVGTPSQPIGLEVARIFKSKSYFMMGKDLPGSPPPPSQVSEILGNRNLDYMRDMNALQSGMGFAFGLHFLVDTGDITFLMFYGRFAAGTGVDFMLKDYGTQVHCEGSSGPIGINGWYANGQAYAFVQGEIGVKVNLRFYKGRYHILKIGAAAVLQTKGPNPFWMKGTVGGYYSILGGLVKGKCSFDVTVGQDCKPVGEQNLLAGINMIAAISPTSNATDIDVFTAPQIAFNLPINQIFTVKDMENVSYSFRAVLDQFGVYDGVNSIEGSLQWNRAQDVVMFDAHEILPGNKTLQLKARLIFEEWKNGVWSKVFFEGKLVDEVVSISFSTGDAPKYIPSHNVSVSYPLRGQVNFYPQEYNKGFIQLKDGQEYLFKLGPEWIQKIRFIDHNNQFIDTPLKYIETSKRIEYEIPHGFQKTTVYQLLVLHEPALKTKVDANVVNVTKNINGLEKDDKITLETKDISGTLENLEVREIYKANFRTSSFNTFVDKMKSLTLSPSVMVETKMNVWKLVSYVKGAEMFDQAELYGLMSQPNLMTVEAMLSDNIWYVNRIHPLLYDGYPLRGISVKRDVKVLGIPPVKDVVFGNVFHSHKLEDGALIYPSLPFSQEFINYNLNVTINQDHEDMALKAMKLLNSQPSLYSERLNNIITKNTPPIHYGSYKVRFSYTIPEVNVVSSTFDLDVFNHSKDF